MSTDHRGGGGGGGGGGCAHGVILSRYLELLEYINFVTTYVHDVVDRA